MGGIGTSGKFPQVNHKVISAVRYKRQDIKGVQIPLLSTKKNSLKKLKKGIDTEPKL